ncbi:MAG TPA: PA0069 family radical SAM protein [Nevskiaceae bacterium]|nr:PA0069 family radical SAM protein [Nevskiaceae bacterium]
MSNAGRRGAESNHASRFDVCTRRAFDDGWQTLAEPLPPRPTTVTAQHARSIISYNQSPDLGFDRSINPYQGCEHGCIYCFARPTHAYLNLSPGLDFETRLFYKSNAAALLDQELRKPGYRPARLVVGANTDPYQPIERRLGITRAVLRVLAAFHHPLTVVTKGALVERDVDVLAPLAAQSLASVCVSVTTLDAALKRDLEPRAAAPAARLRVIRRLSDAGVPVTVLFSPVIPFVNDAEMERVLSAAADAGARAAGYIFLRLPREVAPLFEEWLKARYPLKAAHVMSRVRQSCGGRDYDAAFGTRMRGQGVFADLLRQRFRVACRRFGLAGERPVLRNDLFSVPPREGDQLELFTSR